MGNCNFRRSFDQTEIFAGYSQLEKKSIFALELHFNNICTQ